VLAEILARTRVRVEAARADRTLGRVMADAANATPARSFAAALRGPTVRVIAEHKRRSPSRGAIRTDLRPAEVARAYERAGAAALSVLTEPEFFDGALAHLMDARAATMLPVLRKDFVLDEYQVYEARAAGADAVLLIVAALSDGELAHLLKAAARAGLDALVEVHDAGEAGRALDAGAALVGVNNRDLRTLAVRLETSLTVRAALPDTVVTVAESGIASGDDLRRLRDAGFDAVLVGERLMAAHDPEAALRALVQGAG
jgi:indole-3-glycerol phosphate synthase